MEYFKFMQPKQYDIRKNRFKSLAFRKSSSDEGASVIQAACVQRSCATYCCHLYKYYKKYITSPPVFWIFDRDILPTGHTMKHDDSDGDPCHYLVCDAENKDLEAIVKKLSLDELKICRSTDAGHFTKADKDWFLGLAAEIPR